MKVVVVATGISSKQMKNITKKISNTNAILPAGDSIFLHNVRHYQRGTAQHRLRHTI